MCKCNVSFSNNIRSAPQNDQFADQTFRTNVAFYSTRTVGVGLLI